MPPPILNKKFIMPAKDTGSIPNLEDYLPAAVRDQSPSFLHQS